LFAVSETERPASVGEFWEVLQACLRKET